jgi:heme/copper-type cytochrome/quinol oxidase subunit 1
VTLARSFAVEAVALLLFSLFGGKLLTSGIDLQLHDTYFVLSPKSVGLVMAAILCASAALHSVLPINPRGARWHFWIATIGMIVFWICFYVFGRMVAQGKSMASVGSSAAIATLLALNVSIFMVAISVLIFAVTFSVALFRR